MYPLVHLRLGVYDDDAVISLVDSLWIGCHAWWVVAVHTQPWKIVCSYPRETALLYLLDIDPELIPVGRSS
jgi:hypothetical protein